ASVETALTLGQASEFSFIIASAGLALGHLDQSLFSVITVVTITTMLATPYLINNSNNIITFFTRKSKFLGVPLGGYLGRRMHKLEKVQGVKRKNHLVLLGCHRMGRHILDEIGNKYHLTVLDYDPDVVEELRKEGLDVLYGDVFNSSVLKELDFKNAKIVVSTIPDIDAAVRVIKAVREENKDVVIYARAANLDESLLLYEHGADIVLQPESLAGRKAAQYLRDVGANKRKLASKRIKHLKHLEQDIKH
ncbi:MAG: cation:proton antiporter, partial [Candidatus Diapherotrites archaeon]|nr:cation:proton antiporter [Candidatus Diapherotrites archaeon]